MNTDGIHVQLTAGDYLAANYLHMGWKRTVLIYAFGAAAVGAVSFLTDGSVDAGPDVLLPVAIYLAIIALLFCVSRYLILPRRVRRLYRQQKSMQRAQTVSWDDDYFYVQSEEASVRTLWGDFLKWREGRGMFLLYLSDIVFRIFPKSAFPDEDAIAAFRNMLRNKVNPKENRKRS